MNKIEKAFKECEKFINNSSPDELYEYDKSLNLNIKEYYGRKKIFEDDILTIEYDFIRESYIFSIFQEGHFIEEYFIKGNINQVNNIRLG